MNETAARLAQRVAQRFSLLPEVEAVAIAGSQATHAAGAASDVDIYVYAQSNIPADVRRVIGREFSGNVEIVDYWGPGTEWDDQQTGIHVDTIFFTVQWMEDQIDRILKRHEAWLGYTTCFWHTVRVSRILFDRNGWFGRLQQRAMQAYPEPLVSAIVNHNHPVLRQSASSYLRQLEKAAERGDIVSLNHRVAALLASYFDILFAVNRLPHPGEKRLLDLAEQHCAKRPVNMRQHVIGVITATADSSQSIIQAANVLIDELEALLRSEGLLT